ncbi:MAG TPA: hypothetical protein VI362_03440 [Ignavibacteriaceae bacterium]|nr:hypothetical protein [Ignavibacteriaceae bacterium]
MTIKHSGDTDKKQEIKLESSIEQILWTKNSSSPGGKIGIEVFTKFVGNNSEQKIEISDKSGKTFETIKGKIIGNHYWKEITVPEKAKDELYAEVKLSKHSLSKKSLVLYLFPLVEIKNLKWDKDEVHRGDVLKLTADIKGLADGNQAEIQIWEHDADQAHDLITKFPVTIKNQKVEAEWEFQYVDDTDDIPTGEESENGYQWPEYFFRVIAAGKSADSGLLKFKDSIEINLQFDDGEGIADEEYIIILPDGKEIKGSLDKNGYAREDKIPPGKFEISFPNIG